MADLNEKECNTCKFYDPSYGVCEIDGSYKWPYEPPCEKWVDWEENDER